MSKIEHISCDNSEIGCQLLLITNRKSPTGFLLVPTSMTLNDLERRNSPYHRLMLRFSPNSIALQADYVTVVEDRPVMSVKLLSLRSNLPLLAKTNARRSLSAIAEHLVIEKLQILILRKISRCQILRVKCTKMDFGWGSAPDPAGGAYSAPPDLPPGFKGTYF